MFRLGPDRRLARAGVYATEVASLLTFGPDDEVERLLWWDCSHAPSLAALDATIARLVISDR